MSGHRAQRARRRRRQQGFTLMEVMVSLGVMTIGAMAMIALQQFTVRSNVHGRHMNDAMQIAQTWIERFKQDARQWNQIGFFNDPARPTAQTVLQNTTYLQQVINNPRLFQAIPLPAGSVYPSTFFDAQGNELPFNAPGGRQYYCVTYRPSWVYFGRAIRVDVRVFWPRAGAAIGGTSSEDWFTTNFDDECGGPAGTQASLDTEAGLHLLQLPTVVRPTTP